ncbi:hypothetical protein [Halopiger djelfimassiliensis]|uniref:hypothetical protein n=1 Tax=Halopiger djelfimassiliensis TaxID=1293047 RepID=UPI00067781D8|nr:hypothetical protein [Halopiger djelfimassiliensis]
MNDSIVLGGSLCLSFVLAGVVSVVTGSPAVLGMTPAGLAIYLAVGVGMPQYLRSRRRESPLPLGLAAFAVGGATIATVAGLAFGSLNEAVGLGIVPILTLVVLGPLLGAGVREFRAGYRSGSRA